MTLSYYNTHKDTKLCVIPTGLHYSKPYKFRRYNINIYLVKHVLYLVNQYIHQKKYKIYMIKVVLIKEKQYKNFYHKLILNL